MGAERSNQVLCLLERGNVTLLTLLQSSSPRSITVPKFCSLTCEKWNWNYKVCQSVVSWALHGCPSLTSLWNPTFQLPRGPPVRFLEGMHKSCSSLLCPVSGGELVLDPVFNEWGILGAGVGVGQLTCSLAYCPEVDIFKLLELQEITFLREPPVRMTAFSLNLPSYFSRLTYPESHIHIHAYTVFYLMSLSLFKHSSGQDTLLE